MSGIWVSTLASDQEEDPGFLAPASCSAGEMVI